MAKPKETERQKAQVADEEPIAQQMQQLKKQHRLQLQERNRQICHLQEDREKLRRSLRKTESELRYATAFWFAADIWILVQRVMTFFSAVHMKCYLAGLPKKVCCAQFVTRTEGIASSCRACISCYVLDVFNSTRLPALFARLATLKSVA